MSAYLSFLKIQQFLFILWKFYIYLECIFVISTTGYLPPTPPKTLKLISLLPSCLLSLSLFYPWVQLVLTTHVLEWDHPLGHGKAISSHIHKEKWLALFSIQELLVIAQPGMRIPWLPWSYEACAQTTTGGKLTCASDMWYPEESMSQLSFHPAALPLFLTLLPWCSLSLGFKICSRGGILCLVLYSSQNTMSGEATDPSLKTTCVVLIGHVVKLLSKCLCQYLEILAALILSAKLLSVGISSPYRDV